MVDVRRQKKEWALDVNLQRAAEQRSELSPRRGFASLGLGWLDWQSREAATESSTEFALLPVIAIAPPGSVGKSRRDAMFIESSIPNLGSPFMGERRLVALLKELLSLIGLCVSINISPLRGFFRQTLRGSITAKPRLGLNSVRCSAAG
jgi:hypothetical protein